MHSVIIPHRGRETHLELCLWSLRRSACACGVTDWEPVVVDDPVPDDSDGFNKARALNLGIERARGDILTILDVDAIVGRRFLEAALCLLDAPKLDRCCYRVRVLPIAEELRIETAVVRTVYVDELFSEYESYPQAMECYGTYCLDTRHRPPGNGRGARAWDTAVASGKPWGNSQFSITRDKLGDVRYDESIGLHIEDMDMNMMLQDKFGKAYRSRIFTDAEHAMFHLDHKGHPWDNRDLGMRRTRIHTLKRKRLLEW